MHNIIARYAVIAAPLIAATHAVEDIVVPDTIAAATDFNATFQGVDSSDKYRVYLAAALTGTKGPTCYLLNSTSLDSPLTLSIPASAGPSADYYSIAIADITNSDGATYSNTFNLTGGTGNYTDYESHLGGAPFWDADDLPCHSYACARRCAQASYPADLTSDSAFQVMQNCILKCAGVSAATSATAPVSGTTEPAALITVASDVVLTAFETTVTSGGSTITKAIIDGSETITQGGAEATVSSEVLSLASSGIVAEGSVTTTVAFATNTSASAASTSSAAALRREVAAAGLIGAAGIAAVFL